MDSLKIVLLFGGVYVSSIQHWEAITDYETWYVNRMYGQEWNEGAPFPSDPATTSPSARHQICEQITQSGAFKHYGRKSFVRRDEEYGELQQQPQYSNVFNRLFGPANEENTSPRDGYTNLYARETFAVKILSADSKARWSLIYRKEHVFMCLLQRDADPNYDLDDFDELEKDSIIPIYISKLYEPHDGQNAHRYVFMKREGTYNTMLVEESGEVYTKPDFNIEQEYINVKKEHPRRAKACRHDPVCKLNMGAADKIQTFRLCALVLTASYFKDTVAYPRRVSHRYPATSVIAFQSEAGGIEAAEPERLYHRLYREWTLQCWANMVDGDVKIFHISRAYKTNEVFVYTWNRQDHRLFLEALVKNVRIVYEPDHSDDDNINN